MYEVLYMINIIGVAGCLHPGDGVVGLFLVRHRSPIIARFEKLLQGQPPRSSSGLTRVHEDTSGCYVVFSGGGIAPKPPSFQRCLHAVAG